MLDNPYYLRDNTKMEIDPFSEILKLMNAQTVVSGGFTAGGPWAMRFPPPEKMKFFALVKGSCWLRIDGIAEPAFIEAGDMYLVSAQRSFVLASDLAVTPLDAVQVFRSRVSKIAKLGESEDCIQIGCHVRLDPSSRRLLEDVLPPLIHVRAASPQTAVLQWLLDQLVREQAGDLPGANIATSQLAQLMFVQLLRAYLSGPESLPVGWLRALSDGDIAPILRLMHGDPSRAWSLEELAKAAAMSRTTFTVRFKSVAGVPPLTYLLNWRMRLAEHALREGDTPISDIGLSLGYTSESAFSNAFKRVMGTAPKRYRDALRKSPSADAILPDSQDEAAYREPELLVA